MEEADSNRVANVVALVGFDPVNDAHDDGKDRQQKYKGNPDEEDRHECRYRLPDEHRNLKAQRFLAVVINVRGLLAFLQPDAQ